MQPAGLVTDLKEARQRGSVYSRDPEQGNRGQPTNRGRLEDTLGVFIHGVRGRPLFDSLSDNRIPRGKSKGAKVRAQVICGGNRREVEEGSGV